MSRQGDAKEKRQLVNFLFYKADPAWRRLPEAQKEKGRQEFLQTMEQYQEDIILVTYSLVGVRSDSDLMLWRIGYDMDRLQCMAAELSRTGLGCYLNTAYSYLAMTKRSVYVDRHVHEGQEGSRMRIVRPGVAKYLFVYPFVKTRSWYLLSQEERQKMMDVHITIGHKYPGVKLNTTYSFGLDDQEFVVAFETDQPEDFLDLVMALRETQSSLYTLRDTPIFTCVRRDAAEALALLG
ncbi:MAG: chlorite dismutase family protein [Acidobacteria bacterium]|nr:chlorite dismutase family protein [Acidobacteriota bacterium]